MLFALGPAFGHALSALLIWRFPLDEKKHAQTRRALDEYDAAIAATMVRTSSDLVPTALASGVGPVTPQPSM
jgi:Na+/melibiose symporter-like transporter